MKEPRPKASLSLVELSAQYSSVAAQLIAMGGELTPDTEAMLEATQTALCEKTDGYGIVLDELEAEAAFWKFQKDKCAAAQKAIEGVAESLKNRMRYVLSQREEQSLQGDVYRFFLARAADSIDVDETVLPARFKVSKLVTSADREAIKAAIAAGEAIEGVTVKPNTSLRSGRPK
jgi:gamma-glutamylcyclotransferase (GGCT)/AIG2-like uncharacterized protein YtfP